MFSSSPVRRRAGADGSALASASGAAAVELRIASRGPLAAEEPHGGLATRYLTLFAGEVFSKLCVFLAFAYLARVLGPQGFGTIELALAITLFFVNAVDGGLGSHGARLINTEPEEARRVLARVVVLRSTASVLAYAPLVALSWWFGLPGVGLLAVYGLTVFTVPLFNQWIFQGFRAMHWVAAGGALRNMTFAILVFALARPGSDLRLVGIAEVAGAAALGVMNLVVLRRVLKLTPDWTGAARGAARMLREAWPLGAGEISWFALWYSPSVVLGAFASGQEVAWLAGPLRIVLALHTFVWLYFFNLLPGLSRALGTFRDEWRSLVTRSLHTALWPAFGVAVGCTLVAPVVIERVYGPAYGAAAVPLQIVIWMIPIAWFSGHFRYSLIGGGHQRWDFAASGLAALVTASLAFVLAERMGAVGAALALIAGGLVNAAVAYAAVARYFERVRLSRATSPVLVAAALSLAVGFGTRSVVDPIVGGVLGIVVFMLLALRRRKELVQLARLSW